MMKTMATPIEEYALLSNCRTAALVSRGGSIDWLCLPRLDSPSVFGALLGTENDGRWLIKARGAAAGPSRHYDGGTFTLVSQWHTSDGVAEVRDTMPVAIGPTPRRTDIVRRIRGISGRVDFDVDLRIRFDYARALPWVRQLGTTDAPELLAVAGPDAIIMRGMRLVAHERSHRGSVTVRAGDTVDLTLTGFESYRKTPEPLDIDRVLADTHGWWQDWADRIRPGEGYTKAVERSLLVLRALTNRDTGGIAAAATTSLPEDFGGVRNWDYRFVWLRDAALTLEALLAHGFVDLADHWRTWLLRAVAGDPSDLQIMYGLAGERNVVERELAHLDGYAGSRPVRVGNGAALQYQADVVGEVMVTLAAARAAGLEESQFSWSLERHLARYAAAQFDRPDNGIWEIRGEQRFFTHSRVMMWATFDRAVRGIEEHGMPDPRNEAPRWRELRDRARDEIGDRGVSADGHFTQHYDTDEVDASLLLLPQVGFCAPGDPRMVATVARIEATLLHRGLVMRYRTDTGIDGLPGGEHPFLACSFWLVEQYASTGRMHEANALMARLCALRNDVGMLSEEYDPVAGRQVGNTPQALSHLALVRAADVLRRAPGVDTTRGIG